MKVFALPPEVEAQIGANYKVIIYAADVAALGAAANAVLAILPASGTIPAGSMVKVIAMQLVTAFDFSDAGITSCLLEVGDGGSTARLLAQTEIAVDGTEILYAAGTGLDYAFSVADTVDAKFTVANGGSPLLNETTVGEVELYLRIYDLNSLKRVQ